MTGDGAGGDSATDTGAARTGEGERRLCWGWLERDGEAGADTGSTTTGSGEGTAGLGMKSHNGAPVASSYNLGHDVAGSTTYAVRPVLATSSFHCPYHSHPFQLSATSLYCIRLLNLSSSKEYSTPGSGYTALRSHVLNSVAFSPSFGLVDDEDDGFVRLEVDKDDLALARTGGIDLSGSIEERDESAWE